MAGVVFYNMILSNKGVRKQGPFCFLGKCVCSFLLLQRLCSLFSEKTIHSGKFQGFSRLKVNITCQKKGKKLNTLNESKITPCVLVLPLKYNFIASFLVKGNE